MFGFTIARRYACTNHSLDDIFRLVESLKQPHGVGVEGRGGGGAKST